MKVAVDARGAVWFAATGIGVYVRQLVLHLLAVDRLNRYVVLLPAGDAPAAQALAQACVGLAGPRACVVWVPEHADRSREQEFIEAVLSSLRPDIYHVPQNGVGSTARPPASCKTFVTLHDVIPYVLPATCSRRYRRAFLFQVPALVRRADTVITVSQVSRTDITRCLSVSPEKLAVTYEAAEPMFRPLDRSACAAVARARWGLSGPFVLHVGGTNPRKNVVSLLEAFSRVSRRLTYDLRLVVVARRGPETEQLEATAASLGVAGRVVFTGVVPRADLPVLYNAAWLFVYPSLYEGFGLPPVEAMACATPTITSSVSSLPEVVGSGAVQVPPDRSDLLAEEMTRLLEDRRLAAEVGRRGLAWARRFSWQKTAVDTLLAYERDTSRNLPGNNSLAL